MIKLYREVAKSGLAEDDSDPEQAPKEADAPNVDDDLSEPEYEYVPIKPKNACSAYIQFSLDFRKNNP